MIIYLWHERKVYTHTHTGIAHEEQLSRNTRMQSITPETWALLFHAAGVKLHLSKFFEC